MSKSTDPALLRTRLNSQPLRVGPVIERLNITEAAHLDHLPAPRPLRHF